jgi:CheY-like chemotaxis protein
MADILVVDDNADLRRLFKAMLGRGNRIFEAEDGAGALQMIRQVHPKLVFLDVMMPGELNGLQVLSAVREDPALCSTPIVIVTARGQEVDLANAERHGADGYVVKPFGLKELKIWTDKYLQ